MSSISLWNTVLIETGRGRKKSYSGLLDGFSQPALLRTVGGGPRRGGIGLSIYQCKQQFLQGKQDV